MARHVPHLFVPPPWDGERLTVDPATTNHLDKVLRSRGTVEITYTDGEGCVGEGLYDQGAIVRGAERAVPGPSRELTIAVAPPKNISRARFVVEKLTELGVSRVLWIETEYGEGRPPRAAKTQAWMRAALEQSRGAHRTIIEGPVSLSTVQAYGTVLYGAQDGADVAETEPGRRLVMCIGPEGGFAPHEIPADATLVKLSRQVLRIETAAVVGAALLQER